MSRLLKWLSVVVGSVVVIVVVAAFAFLWSAPASSSDEVARSQSPQGDIDAVLVETNGGATTSFGYEVFIVPSAAERQKARAVYLYGAVRNSSSYGANLRWVSPSELHVEFNEAIAAKLEQPVVNVSGRAVRVLLRPGVADLTAPPGGMLYNLQRLR